jgi:DNA-directed RNA polymerase subunit M/transcription elongation factor TFIIS
MATRARLNEFARPSGRSRKPAAARTPAKAPAPEVVQESAESLMRSIASSVDLNDDQVQELLSLQYPDGSSVISLDERGVIFEIIGLLQMRPYDESVDYIRESSDSEALVRELPTLQAARDKIMVNLHLLRVRESGVKGVERCRRCGSDEVVFAEKQLRGADEPATTFIRCVMCQNRWRQ